MSKVRKAIDARDQHIMSLRIVIGVLLLVMAGLWWGWKSAPDKLTVHVPPDLRTGSTRGVSEIPPSNIYAFGLYIFQQLNRWTKDGNTDYQAKINGLSCFMTPTFLEDRQANYDTKRTRFELGGRERYVHEIPGSGYKANRVYIESPDSWVTYLDLQIKEFVSGEVIKDSLVRFPLRVVRYDVDPECNPWGLALDGFSETPTRLSVVDNGEENF